MKNVFFALLLVVLVCCLVSVQGNEIIQNVVKRSIPLRQLILQHNALDDSDSDSGSQ
ncbi:AGAP003474-PA [Anopheles gambiae str. PEST]|uniref:AGAP003474-PA n=2 Tax=gambiae species complex TaxID=44542 RepID=Q7QDE9_ANOGA|nr:uncharacterized protein LOC120952759 [Anopheles coluzzii]XP_311762.2 uncharacterized protein LOC1272845 [Anopheles gambiae]EAA07309.2 AGAP003474-PA [Anopheles gambiae str. PEST]